MSCTLSRSLTGNCKNNKLFGGGIKSTVSLFKLSETKFNSEKGLSSLVIDDIYSENRYDIDISNLDYELSVSDNNFSHKLEGKIYNLDSEIQKALFETENDRYIVIFRPKGDNLRGFGFSFGAILSHSQDINSDEASYTITLEEKSPYSLFELDYNIFDEDKEFEPIYKAGHPVCILENGKQTGEVRYNSFLKYNSFGEPLDIFNIRTSQSGLYQAGYFYSDFPAEQYQVLGTYGDSGVVEIDGIFYDTREYNPTVCKVETAEDFTVEPSIINLDTTTNMSEDITVYNKNNRWSLIDKDYISFCDVDKVFGESGTSKVTVSNGKGGTDTLRFQDLETLDIRTVIVNSYVIRVPYYRATFGPDTLNFTIPIESFGGDNDFTFTSNISPSLVSFEKRDGVIYGFLPNGNLNTETIVTLTINHSNWSLEEKEISLTFLKPGNTDPVWTTIGSYCQIEGD